MKPFIYQLVKAKSPTVEVACSGAMNEQSTEVLARLVSDIGPRGPVCIDCEGIEFINSAGASAWSRFVEAVTAAHTVTVKNCSVFFADYANVVAAMVQGVTVESFHLSTRCTACRHEQEVLIERRDTSLGRFRCTLCRGELAGDSDFDDFLGLFHDA